MAFKHQNALLSVLTAQTDRHLRDVAQAIERGIDTNTGRIQTGPSGILMDRHLAVLCRKLRTAVPKIQFAINGRDDRTLHDSRLHHSLCEYREVWAYLPGQTYALMRLGYKQHYTNSQNSSTQYGVYARHLTNGKFSDACEEYHMSISENVDRALAVAKKQMRPYTVQEVLDLSAPDYENALRKAHRERISQVADVSEGLRNNIYLMQELRHLISTDYEFKYPTLKEDILMAFKVRDEADAANAIARHAWSVVITMHGDRPSYSVTEIFNVGTTSSRRSTTTTYGPDDFPEELAGKVSVLMMASNFEHIDGVGMKVAPSIFFVDRIEA
jgi:hypothetical protein